MRGRIVLLVMLLVVLTGCSPRDVEEMLCDLSYRIDHANLVRRNHAETEAHPEKWQRATNEDGSVKLTRLQTEGRRIAEEIEHCSPKVCRSVAATSDIRKWPAQFRNWGFQALKADMSYTSYPKWPLERETAIDSDWVEKMVYLGR